MERLPPRACVLVRYIYPASKSAEAGESRRGLYGRLAIYVSLAFLLLNVRQPVWSTYLAVLNQSNLLREFVLKNDVKTSSPHRSGFFASSGPRPGGDFEMLLSSAYRLAASNQVSEAKKVYLRMITMAESIGHAPENGGTGKHQQALALNPAAIRRRVRRISNVGPGDGTTTE